MRFLHIETYIKSKPILKRLTKRQLPTLPEDLASLSYTAAVGKPNKPIACDHHGGQSRRSYGLHVEIDMQANHRAKVRPTSSRASSTTTDIAQSRWGLHRESVCTGEPPTPQKALAKIKIIII